MDTSHIELLKGIENAISTPRDYDWWMFGITAANVIAFVILTIYIAKLNKKVSKNQDDLQKRNLKLQLFEKRYPIYLAILEVREKFEIDYSDIINSKSKLLNNNFHQELAQTLRVLKQYTYSTQFLFDIEFILYKNIMLFVQLQETFLKDYLKLSELYTENEYEIEKILYSYEDGDFLTWIGTKASSNDFFKYFMKLYYYGDKETELIFDKIEKQFQEYLNVNDLEK
ncbi:MAG: hypothetical protein H6Q15_1596 [Bacteroidetes bacterium]|nr:hypothetical protein [Bacteroidota bacterium]